MFRGCRYMENQVAFHHFVPKNKDQESCSELISRVDESAPSDSSVTAFVDRLADGTFRTVISVKAVCGKFYSEATNFSLVSSIKQAQQAMLNSLDEWKSRRFRS